MQGIAHLLNTPSLLEEWLHAVDLPIGIVEQEEHFYTYTYMNKTMQRVTSRSAGLLITGVHNETEASMLEEGLHKALQTGCFEHATPPFLFKIYAIPTTGSFLIQFQRDGLRKQKLENYESIVHNSLESIFIHDKNGHIVYLNPAAVALLGAKNTSECIGRSVRGLIQDEPESDVQKRLRLILESKWSKTAPIERKIKRVDGEVIEVELTGSKVTFDGKPAVQTVCRNISERRRKQSRLEEMAYYDQLTQVSNRRYFFEQLKSELEACEEADTILSVLFIDLDNFKDINDQHGHHVGDDVLIIFTKRVKQMLRETDTFSRLGGDEFVVLLTNLHSTNAPEQVAERMIERITQPIVVGGKELHISVSIGIAMYPGHGTTRDNLLAKADQALYEAKNNGRKCVSVYHHS
ncbi:sensor domain-containing diguanylate cyclase [Halobacillus salinus]|uniref:sensor domain-containing diguanylate cyclase n=1 Tax=Halobacillus salinus TaxID=192814 RepID=UPI0009A7E0F0|nr:sensor domain-containing diguanylate cyclase [Halobacillus salinus]